VVGDAVVGDRVVGDGVGVTEGNGNGDGDGATVVVFEDGATLGAGDTVVSFPYENSSNNSSHPSSITSS